MTITLHISEDAAATLRQALGENLDRAALESMAIAGYRAGKLSITQVGALLGLDNRWDTENWLGEQGVPWNYSLDDLESDRRTIDKLFGDAPQ